MSPDLAAGVSIDRLTGMSGLDAVTLDEMLDAKRDWPQNNSIHEHVIRVSEEL